MLLSPNAQTALIAAAAGWATTAVPRILQTLTRGAATRKRLTLENVRADQDRLDASYNRLESENVRLTGEVRDLRERLGTEERLHNRTRDRCAQMESILLRLNIQLPSGRDPRPTGEEGSR